MNVPLQEPMIPVHAPRRAGFLLLFIAVVLALGFFAREGIARRDSGALFVPATTAFVLQLFGTADTRSFAATHAQGIVLSPELPLTLTDLLALQPRALLLAFDAQGNVLALSLRGATPTPELRAMLDAFSWVPTSARGEITFARTPLERHTAAFPSPRLLRDGDIFILSENTRAMRLPFALNDDTLVLHHLPTPAPFPDAAANIPTNTVAHISASSAEIQNALPTLGEIIPATTPGIRAAFDLLLAQGGALTLWNDTKGNAFHLQIPTATLAARDSEALARETVQLAASLQEDALGTLRAIPAIVQNTTDGQGVATAIATAGDHRARVAQSPFFLSWTNRIDETPLIRPDRHCGRRTDWFLLPRGLRGTTPLINALPGIFSLLGNADAITRAGDNMRICWGNPGEDVVDK